MKKYKKDVEKVLIQSQDLMEIISDERIWIDIAAAYCEANPLNEDTPVKISLLLDNILKKNDELNIIMEKFTSDLYKIV